MLGPMLVSLHNVTFYQRLMSASRAAIKAGVFGAFADEKLRCLGSLGI
jgi:queuine tRNA-ribosyltransferase